MRLALLFAAALAVAAPAAAQPAAPLPVRGVVTQIDAARLTVKPKSGKPVTVDLTPDWTVQVTKPIAVTEIKEGSFIGTAELPQADGTGRSLEVHVFPPGVKMGEGHYGWDLKKGSMMTNGTVGTVVAGKRGSRELDVNYSYGKRHITVPAKVPVVQITPGRRDQIKPGVPVFLVVQKRSDGTIMSGGVSIGENGAKPPM